MTFTEEWFPKESCAALADIAVEVAAVPGRIVEIGSWQGRSTAAIANAINPRRVHAVDTWRGSPDELSEALAADRDVFAEFTANMEELTAGNVDPFRMGWREYVGTFAGPVALVFIDAEHTEVEVRDCIEAFKPLMAAGGIMCGDDAHHEPVVRGVVAAFPDERPDIMRIATLWVRR